MGELPRDFTLAELAKMGIDVVTLKRVKRDLRQRAADDPLEKDACTVPLISAHVARVVGENFGLPFVGTQDNVEGHNSALASMFIRMNSYAFYQRAINAATSELDVYKSSSENGGFLFQLDKWLSDRHRFGEGEERMSALIGGSLLLQMVRTQVGYEFVEKINRTKGGFDVPAHVISGREWMEAFDKIFQMGIDRTNPIERLKLPKIPREQVDAVDTLEKARLIVPVPNALDDGALGVYQVLDKNWAKLKVR